MVWQSLLFFQCLNPLLHPPAPAFPYAPEKADYVLTQVEKTFSSLSESPERGVYPKELLAVGIREYREIFFKPYRIIYRIIERNIYVLLIADGRRDM